MGKQTLGCVIFVLFSLISCAQDNEPVRIETESAFSNLGDYNSESNCLLYFGVDVNSEKKQMISSSIRVKFLETGKEITLQNNTLSPALGWLDSSHVLLETSVSIGEQKLFGDWKVYLVRHNIFTHRQDTLPSSWYTSSNHVENFLTSNNRFFYTISYGAEEMKSTYWIEYLISTGESKVIKKYDEGSFSILTYQYLPDIDEIIYVKSKANKKKLIRLSLSTGIEKVIKTMPSQNIEESSAVINAKFYYVVREFPKDSSGHLDWKKVRYLLKSLDLKTGLISDIYASKSEITKVSPYKEGRVLLSIQGNSRESSVEKSFDLKAGGEVTVGLDVTSYLYVLKLD